VSETLQTSGQLDAWAREIRSIGNSNPLLNFESNTFGQLNLEKAHPGGLAQFATARVTTLSSLFREPLAFSQSLAAAKRIAKRGSDLVQQAGLETVYLASGLVNLNHAGFDLELPIILRPVSLRRKTDDYEVALVGGPAVNPGLVTALEVSYGVHLNTSKLIELANASQDLLPIEVLEYVSEQVGSEAILESSRLLVVGNFAIEPLLMQSDLPKGETKLLRQLAGLAEVDEPSGDKPAVRLVVDADSVQELIVAKAVAGDSFAVETLPGCGYTQTVVNVLANLVQSSKRVLVVTPRRQTLNELADRLSSIGLGGLGIRTHSTWFDLVAAISRHEKAQPADLDTAISDRAKSEQAVSDYLDALARVNPDLEHSIGEILSKLASISLMPNAPTSAARISKSKLIQHKDPTRALELLTKASELGEFDFGPQDTPWFGARFQNADEVQDASDLAKRLSENFDSHFAAMSEFVSTAGFKPASSFEDWGVYLQLASGVRLTLDRFVEDVYQRDLTPLVLATGPRTAKSDISGSDRRRLRKLAKEYLRPGMHVSDLHTALIEVREQKELWSSITTGERTPWVPAGVSDLQVAHHAFATDLAAIQRRLDPSSDAIPLVKLSLSDLKSALHKMATDLLPLKNFAERASVVAELRELGLGSVARDFARIHVSKEQLALEFDLVYWQSALEYAVAKDSRVLAYTPEQIEVLESDFRNADETVVRLGAASLAAQQAELWKTALQAGAESAALKELLRTKRATVAEVSEVAPNIAKLLCSVVLTSPFDVPASLANQEFDVALVLDAAGTTTAENLSALRRVEQVIAFGDEAIASPLGFEIECLEAPIALEAADRSIFAVVHELFGSVTLRRSWRQNGQTLGALINREFYQNRINFEPTASEYLGDSNFLYVNVKSRKAELEKTVSLVLEHARNHPELSLLVGTASEHFAEEVRGEIQANLLRNPELEEFFDSHGREKFEVVTIAELSHRISDVVIFSLGLTENPELLSSREARKFVANLLVSARARITMVSALENLPGNWPLATLMNDILGHSTSESETETDDVVDPMLTDLALRLRKLGVRVTLGYGARLPMVMSYGNKAAVVQADWLDLGQPISDRLRLHPALLEGMGWQLIKVHSFELFSDPQTTAMRIALALGLPLAKSQPVLFDERSKDDSDLGWGEAGSSNDRRLKDDKPPHWG
jgi:hypothetical protein